MKTATLTRIGLAFAVFAVAIWAAAQPSNPRTFTPNETEALKLKVAQQEWELSSVYAQQAQQRFQAAIAAFSKVCNDIKTANKWPAETQCDPQTLAVTAPPAPPPPKLPDPLTLMPTEKEKK